MPTIATSNARVQYWTAGSGAAVVLVQGAGVIGEGWRPQIDALKDRYTVIWIDNRGIGQKGAQQRKAPHATRLGERHLLRNEASHRMAQG